MPTVFGKEGDDFYNTFWSEPDPTKRAEALDRWVDESTPAIQKAVSEELRAFVDGITLNRWTEAGYAEGFEKLHRVKNDYHLVMDIKLRKVGPKEQFKGELPPVDTNSLLTPSAIKRNPSLLGTRSENGIGRQDQDDDGGDHDGNDGHSSNDDRSDSMNPNNDSYQSSMDNRSDQMNPNNDAYGSSRGR